MAKPAVYVWPAASTTAIAATQSITLLNSIALLQNAAGAGNLTLNGNIVANGVAYIQAAPQKINITSANDLHLLNFTITGTNNGTPITEILAGPNVNTVYSVNQYTTITNIAVSGAGNGIKVGAAAPLALTANPYVYTGISRNVSITAAADQSAATFTINGTLNGNVVSESIAGPAAPGVPTVYTTQFYDSVTSVVSNFDFANVSIGTGLLGYTHWYLYNYHASVLGFTAEVDRAATTINYTFETTLDDVTLSNYAPVLNVNIFAPIFAMTSASTSQFSPYNNVMRYSRIAVLNGTTATGAFTATFLQQGIT